MNSKYDGGPAFPRTGEGVGNPNYDEPGMSLRDWFAGQALAGLLANSNTIRNRREQAETAYAQADAMLAERSRKS